MLSRSSVLHGNCAEFPPFLAFVLIVVALLASPCNTQAQDTSSSSQSALPLPPLLAPQTAGGRHPGVHIRHLNSLESNATQNSASSFSCKFPQLSYFDGPVISNVQVVPVFWGNHVNSEITANISQFFSDVAQSNWLDTLSEYASVGGTNQSIGRGTAAQGITINPSVCSSSSSCTITDDQLQTELNAQIQSGVLPSPAVDISGNTNTLYMVYFPPNVTLTAFNQTSCVNFCAYHNTGTFGSSKLPLPYGAIMDHYATACSTGCGNESSAFKNETVTSAHELAEAITDTDIGLDTQAGYAFPAGWGDNNNNCGEIADICDTATSVGPTITGVSGNTWTVEGLYSNKLDACVGLGLAPKFVFIAPPTASVGTPFRFVVYVQNPSGNQGTDTAYVGTVHFTSSDPNATLPVDFTYTTGDQGTADFSATLNTGGSQMITATDTLNGHIVGTSSTISMSATVPGAPIIGAVTSGNSQATVNFIAPSSNGGATITGYTAISSPGGNTGNCTASPCVVTGLTNGTAYSFTVTATNSVGTGPASGASNSVTPVAGQTITFNNPGPRIYGISYALTATANSTLPVTFSSGTPNICTVTSGSTLTPLAPGTCTINANQAGNAAWLAALQVPQTFLVNPAPLTVTANDATKVYGATNPIFTGTAAGLVNGDTASSVGLSYSTTATASSTIGSYPIMASITSSNYTLSVTPAKLTITQAGSATTLSASSSSITPGQSVTLTATVASATTGTPTGTVNFYDGTAVLGTDTLVGGTATLNTTALNAGATNALSARYGGDTNFTPSSTTASLSVTAAPLDFTFTLTGSASQTLNPGSSASYNVMINPMYGSYAGPVSLNATGLPPGATVSFSPATIAANGGQQTVVVTIHTQALAAMHAVPSIGRRLAPVTLAFLLLPLVGVRRMRRRLSQWLCLLVLLGGVTLAATGCGSANGFFAQAPKSYDVTVTATAGNLQHSTIVTLEVQ